ncbi:hypothetical protein COO60DRAFT_1234573 [Scenedesmus sp. NREL 46B-D3]|nr:hypothetical protein COO60DRAFT_1234573 [Scenedesmus sp. NREL 46B-D3]
MQPDVNAPVVEAHEDQQVDLTLAQLQQDLQEQLQQHQRSRAAQPAAASSGGSLPSSMQRSADSSAATDPAEEAAAASEAAAGEEAAAAGAVPASTLISSSQPASTCEDESEWHLVSPSGSVRLHGGSSSSSRASFDCSGASPRTGSHADADEAAARLAGDDEGGSCCGSEPEAARTHTDDLAASILGHSVLTRGSMLGSAGGDEAPTATAAVHGSDAGTQAARLLSSEAGTDGLPAADAAPAGADEGTGAADAAADAAAKDGAAAAGVEQAGVDAEVLTGLGLLGGEVARLVGAAQGRAGASLQGLREWLLESLAALVQSGRVSQAACVSTRESIQRSLHVMAKQGGIAAAAVGAAADWRLVLSSAAAVVCLAMWMRSRNEAATLRASLRRRDHELSKLVMRLVSLQELLNQGQGLPISRYMRYEGAATVAAAASYM